MKIITLFAMGKDRSVATTDQTNFGLPWKNNKEDTAFVSEILTKYEGNKSVVLMTTSTFNSLPKSLTDRIYERYYGIVLLGKYNLQLPTQVSNEQFARVFKQGLSLIIDVENIDTVLYFGSPRFLDGMSRISNETYITVLDDLLYNPVIDELDHAYKYHKTYLSYDTKEHLLIKSPKTILKHIESGIIYKVASKQYETI